MSDNTSLTKLKVWQKVKQSILSQMHDGIIKPEKADKILSFVKKTLKNIDTIQGLGMYCSMLGRRFPELAHLIESFNSPPQFPGRKPVG